MKKFTSLLIGCSLAFAGAAMAQQPDDQASPKPAVEKGRGHGQAKPKETTNPASPNAAATETKPQGAGGDRRGPKTEPGTPKLDRTAPATTKVEKLETATPKPSVPGRTRGEKAAKTEAAAGEATASATPAIPGATPGAKADDHRRGAKNAPGAKATPTPVATTAPAATPAAKITATPAPTAAPTATATATATATPVASASVAGATALTATPAPSAGVAADRVGRPNPAAPKKPEPQKLEQIKVEHANFRAQPKPDKVPAITFTENRRVEGSDRWQGQKYEAFRSYRSERHDERYYRSRYNKVELIGGGYYYWDRGYWYPAWGYSDAHQYYAYDGPIYVGQQAKPLDRVIADVQTVLQEMGYYKGEVDGLLGPLTRQALTGYQEDQGLAPTAAIDEPTLDSLGMES